MAGDFLLDTNVLIAYFAGDRNVLQKLKAARTIYVSITALGELYYGAKKSSRVEENLDRIKLLLQGCAILQEDMNTADIYGEIKNQKRKKGRPIPDNDLWIAAMAKQHGLTLVTRDAHFCEVENLRLESW